MMNLTDQSESDGHACLPVSSWMPVQVQHVMPGKRQHDRATWWRVAWRSGDACPMLSVCPWRGRSVESCEAKGRELIHDVTPRRQGHCWLTSAGGFIHPWKCSRSQCLSTSSTPASREGLNQLLTRIVPGMQLRLECTSTVIT